MKEPGYRWEVPTSPLRLPEGPSGPKLLYGYLSQRLRRFAARGSNFILFIWLFHFFVAKVDRAVFTARL